MSPITPASAFRSLTLVVAVALLQILTACSGNPGGSNTQTDDVPIEFSKTDQAMNGAIAEAKRTMPEFIAAFDKHDPKHVVFSLKKPFPCPDGGQEHMWIMNIEKRDGAFRGRIDNTAECATGVRLGDIVVVKPDEISDWMIVTSDQRLIGGYTIRVMRDNMSDQERAKFDASMGLTIDP